MPSGTASENVGTEDVLRAQYYALLSRLLVQSPDADTLEMLGALGADDSDFGKALGALAQVASQSTPETAIEEFTKLFYGFGAGGEVMPYESLYLTGLMYDKPLAALRSDLAEFGIENSKENNEPEDHAAYILEIMHHLIMDQARNPVGVERQGEFFHTHIASWMEKLFEDLETSDSSVLYAPIGTIGRLFVRIESEAFEMAA
ncbi:MAG: molecular chaperone TorD family protein [Rhodospirillales bacterium]|jgi:TorA maturation chaperone TorD|nr:molecular chaperone TorD family protein [Rhodospirillales bacterium]MBT5352615.1 molecular chaperone TorD family protein [Rhodospirillales bacterium]MBT6109454.1 molecular chaperone TorD family protein [Rhodospirillales bacterium]MBT6825399.1 molecular chaperone TorD family protein [Rhodospirillales bacterium]